ncbi:hypothetical protein OSB04_013321 [Centaurea solstitialis]|uniref:F-box domain-containing protein n=1 Tax=Centaurea solstitialis TaxID=347529 RepID=A0AA38WFD8_9ASTR|nr:hypothetical protein OSB04_013321 [Centaurea solstitialis]
MREKLEDGYEGSADEDDYDINGKRLLESEARVMKKRKRVVKKKDPLMVCGCDMMSIIFSHLDACSLASSLLVSPRWYRVASTDALWAKKCEELWVGKAHLPRFPQVEGLSKLSVYSLSIADGTRDAPAYWLNLDPYWKGTEPLMHRYFHPDGSQTADPDDQVWGGHECCYSIVTSLLADGKIREHYVRINRRPQMYISRRQDWGWEMSNHLYRYSSVPDAHTKDGTGPYLPAL